MSDVVILDDQDGKPIRECSSNYITSCPHCIVEFVYVGDGDFEPRKECYCKSFFEPFATVDPGEFDVYHDNNDWIVQDGGISESENATTADRNRYLER